MASVTFDDVKDTVSSSIPTLTTYYDSISNLNTRINSVTFDSSSQIYQFFGTLRYLSGDIIYTTSFGIISLLATFYIFKMLKNFINFLFGFTPFNIRLP